MPDIMHLSHLAIIPDIALSLLCDLSDGQHREQTLNDLFENDRSFCESQGKLGSEWLIKPRKLYTLNLFFVWVIN